MNICNLRQLSMLFSISNLGQGSMLFPDLKLDTSTCYFLYYKKIYLGKTIFITRKG
ncbi:MAG: hypothetical protein K0R19_1598 [Bacillota bacterium]|jgi:hypothetical protein|nr:hypothetical protein [Bacillota bacterium]